MGNFRLSWKARNDKEFFFKGWQQRFLWVWILETWQPVIKKLQLMNKFNLLRGKVSQTATNEAHAHTNFSTEYMLSLKRLSLKILLFYCSSPFAKAFAYCEGILFIQALRLGVFFFTEMENESFYHQEKAKLAVVDLENEKGWNYTKKGGLLSFDLWFIGGFLRAFSMQRVKNTRANNESNLLSDTLM